MAYSVYLSNSTNKSQILQNITTIEAMEKTRYTFNSPRPSSDDKINPFNIGKRQNWNQVMGPSPLKWFLPFQNSIGNGLAFPVSEDIRGLLQGMRRDLDENGIEDEMVWTRDESGRWMRHD
jgi:hypothetical protein